jgi:hypothetical protein
MNAPCSHAASIKLTELPDSIAGREDCLGAGAPREPDAMEQRLIQRQAFAGRGQTQTWQAIAGARPRP